jgi:hypothetical protein
MLLPTRLPLPKPPRLVLMALVLMALVLMALVLMALVLMALVLMALVLMRIREQVSARPLHRAAALTQQAPPNTMMTTIMRMRMMMMMLSWFQMGSLCATTSRECLCSFWMHCQTQAMP